MMLQNVPEYIPEEVPESMPKTLLQEMPLYAGVRFVFLIRRFES